MFGDQIPFQKNVICEVDGDVYIYILFCIVLQQFDGYQHCISLTHVCGYPHASYLYRTV